MNAFIEFKIVKSYEETRTLLEVALSEIKFSILWEVDFKERFNAKGIEFHQRIKTLEVCNPNIGADVLKVAPQAANLLPCKVSITEYEDHVIVGMLKPTILVGHLENEALIKHAQTVETLLTDVLASLV